VYKVSFVTSNASKNSSSFYILNSVKDKMFRTASKILSRSRYSSLDASFKYGSHFQKMTVSTSSLSKIGSSESTEPSNIGHWNPQLTKIVATIGPTSEQLPVLQDIVRCGMRVMRLNFSHATVEEVELRVGNLSQCEGRHGASSTEDQDGDLMNVRAVLLDTRGPEIRMGKLKDDFSGKTFGIFYKF
jgi:hypothetical protein